MTSRVPRDSADTLYPLTAGGGMWHSLNHGSCFSGAGRGSPPHSMCSVMHTQRQVKGQYTLVEPSLLIFSQLHTSPLASLTLFCLHTLEFLDHRTWSLRLHHTIRSGVCIRGLVAWECLTHTATSGPCEAGCQLYPLKSS